MDCFPYYGYKLLGGEFSLYIAYCVCIINVYLQILNGFLYPLTNVVMVHLRKTQQYDSYFIMMHLQFVFFPILIGNIDVSSVGPPPTS